MIRQLLAWWVLGWALIRHVLIAPFYRTKGARPWLWRLRQESLTSTPAEAWNYLERTSGCIACGLCDSVGSKENRLSTSESILSVARRPEDAPLALHTADTLDALAEKIAAVCPARVPTDTIAKLIRDNAAVLAEQEGPKA